MKSLTPYEMTNQANIFRLFLRDTFYPSHIQEIKDNIVCYIPGCNTVDSIVYDEINFEYKVLSHTQMVKNITIDMYNFQIMLMLTRLFTASNDLIQLIINDKSKNKELLNNIYNHISTYKQHSNYMVWLFACHIIDVDNDKRVVCIYL